MEEMWTLDQALIWIATRNRELASNLDLLWVDLISALSGMGRVDLPGPVQPDRRPDQVVPAGPVLDWPRAEAEMIEALREERLRAYRITSSGPEFAGATITFDARLRTRITLLPPPQRGSSDDISASPLERPRFSPGEQHEHPWFAPKDVMAIFREAAPIVPKNSASGPEQKREHQADELHIIQRFALQLWPETKGRPPVGMRPKQRNKAIADAMKADGRAGECPSERTLRRFFGRQPLGAGQ